MTPDWCRIKRILRFGYLTFRSSNKAQANNCDPSPPQQCTWRGGSNDSLISVVYPKRGEGRGLILKTEKYVFISYLDSDYSRTSVFLTDTRKENYYFWKVQGTKLGKLRSLIALSMKFSTARTTFIVMSPCHSLVIPLRFLTLRPIILDAGWSLTEALQVRDLSRKHFANKILTYIIDFLSFHLSKISLFESNHQCTWIQKKFLLRKSKTLSIFTGFNEFRYANLNPVMPAELSERSEFQEDYVLFRGSFTNEAALDLLCKISQARKILGKKFVIATNRDFDYFKKCENVILIHRKLSESEIKFLYLNCSLAIGQLRNTLRLANTIPHKAFEAAYFARPYLTADATGIREFLSSDNQAIFTKSEDVEVLADVLSKAIEDRNQLINTGVMANTRYIQVASQEKLQDQFSHILNTVNRS